MPVADPVARVTGKPLIIAALRKAGVERVVMFTGDNACVAEALGRRVGVDEVHAVLLPGDKLRLVGELGRKYGPTAMVGDDLGAISYAVGLSKRTQRIVWQNIIVV